MENQEILKNLISAIIDKDDEVAREQFHHFVTNKSRTIVGQPEFREEASKDKSKEE
jgi:hypothetical protein